MTRCFDELPGLVEEKLREHARVVLIYYDAFGWRFAERHAHHPLLAAANVERWSSMFPSTTTVHSTTIHSGLPLGEHGLYEWNILEPRLNRLVTPLWFCFAGDPRPGTLRDVGLTAFDLFPEQTLYQRLRPVPSHVSLPTGIARSQTSQALLRDAIVHEFEENETGLYELAAALAAEEHAYGSIYFPDADSLMHMVGPDDPTVPELMERTLDAIAATPWPEGTLVLLTADHGMEGIEPERSVYVNVVWPELGEHLAIGADGKPLAPAGSCRDLFLHVLPERLDEVAAELRGRLEGVAEVRKVDDLLAEGLFGPNPTEKLTSRLANLVVLPEPGEAAYWLEPGRFEQRFRGQHGGLSPNEMAIPLVSWTAAGVGARAQSAT
ncbi:MAG TPA: alkaline phosphatase family protein [Gaiellaceae bacterium]|nr:alkaline phosphatase family protein [Gaiellaceae bacterium]